MGTAWLSLLGVSVGDRKEPLRALGLLQLTKPEAKVRQP